MKRIDWPMALVVSVLAVVVGVLQYTERLPHAWEAGIGGLLVLVAGGMRSFLKGGDDAPN